MWSMRVERLVPVVGRNGEEWDETVVRGRSSERQLQTLGDLQDFRYFPHERAERRTVVRALGLYAVRIGVLEAGREPEDSQPYLGLVFIITASAIRSYWAPTVIARGGFRR
jgi:hypothetical protein